jgi:DNA polymerase III delta prime subunit
MAAEPDAPRYLEQWQNRVSANTRPAIAPPPQVTGDRSAYVQAALDAEAETVRTAKPGTRNPTLNTAALKLGRLVPHLTDEATVYATLEPAAQACGLVKDDGIRKVRNTIRSGLTAGQRTPRDPGPSAGGDGGRLVDLTDRLGGPVMVVQERPAPPDLSTYLIDGAAWLLELPEAPPAVWGDGDIVLWSQGEALMIAGSPGVGKTTLGGQLARGRLGLQPRVLEHTVAEGGALLWLAMDRPAQIGRRLRQQFTETELRALVGTGRLVVGNGPPPQDLARHPELLAELCAKAGADTVVVDSLKDAAVGLTDDETAAGYNRARQLTVTAGVQVLELHHLVKRGADGKAPQALADVYGSAWLTAGVGSVLLLQGDAGDPIVRAVHLKQPAEPWGPADLAHDHRTGTTTIHNRVDLAEMLTITGVQTARSAACALFATEKPDRARIERARRKLEGLVRDGRAGRRAAREGSADAWQYVPLADVRELDLGPVMEQ